MILQVTVVYEYLKGKTCFVEFREFENACNKCFILLKMYPNIFWCGF